MAGYQSLTRASVAQGGQYLRVHRSLSAAEPLVTHEGIGMLTKKLNLNPSLGLATCLCALLPGMAAAQQPTQLPGIVIQGAALERAPIAKSQPIPAANDEADEPTPRPQPKKQSNAPKPAASSASASQATPTNALAGAPQNSNAAAGGEAIVGLPAETIGTAVSVVTGDDLRRQQIRSPSDALRGMPGVSVTQTGSSGSLTQVRLRGAEGKHTRVILDGVEVNTTKDGEFDFSNIAIDDIERIEVIRGPMSGIYGSGAIGGVINITTRGAKGPLSASVRTEIGSYGTKDVSARMGGGNDSGYAVISGQWRETSGFNIAPVGSENDGSTLSSFAVKAGIKLAPNAQLDVNVRRTEKRAAIDGFGGTGFYGAAYDTNDRQRDTNWLVGTTLKWDMLDGKLSHELRANHTSSRSFNEYAALGGTVDNRTRSDGDRNTFGYASTYRLETPGVPGRHAFTGLIEKERETFTPFSDFGFFDGDGQTKSRDRLSYAGEWRGTFADRLTLTAGARRDDNTTFQDFNTWRTSASFVLREYGLRPHASVGTAVKLPGMYDQFGPNNADYTSNASLRPETSLGWDGGIEATFLGGKIVTDVTYFKADLKDKIGINYSVFPFTPINLDGKSRREGVEMSARYMMNSTLSLGASYTYTDARDPSGAREVRRAPHSGRGDVRYIFADGKGTASLVAGYNGKRDDYAFQNNAPFSRDRIELGNYWLVGVAASYKIQRNVEVFGRVENATNVKYQEVYGYNAAGVAAYAGVKITFDDLLGTSTTLASR
jgi:vitamin B12 transporter